MNSLGQAGSSKPRVRPGDYERALALITELGGDKKSRQYLADLVAASAAHEKARTVGEAATADASRRETAAMQAEDAARSQREALATETAKTSEELKRDRAENGRECQRLQELAKDLDAKVLDLRLRESAIQRAFAAYQGE